MPNFKKISSHVVFIDYKPAELRINKDWLVVYYYKNPINAKLQLFRVRVPQLESRSERLRIGKRIVLEINNKLLNGWSPFMEESGKNFKTFEAGSDEFLRYIQKQVDEKVFRPDTQRSYNSGINLLKEYVAIYSKGKIMFCAEINRLFCSSYLEWIYSERKNSPRTRNNHLVFLKLFCNFLINRGVLAENPTSSIKAIKVGAKKRAYIPSDVRKKILCELQQWNDGFFMLCMLTYFCFIRNSELGKLKVGDIDFNRGTIFLSQNVSKNKKNESVTIPSQIIENLKLHTKNMNQEYFLFSSDKYLPGKNKMAIRKIQNGWDKLRTRINLEKEYQFYSLKDSGIMDLLNSGVPAIKVRDQARHSEITITELYTHRSIGSDSTIQNAKISF